MLGCTAPFRSRLVGVGDALQESDSGDLQLARFKQEQVWPSRADRRRHLKLEWVESEFSAPPWKDPILRIRLINVGMADWMGRPGDVAEVVARIHDLENHELLPSVVHCMYAPAHVKSEKLAIHSSREQS